MLIDDLNDEWLDNRKKLRSIFEKINPPNTRVIIKNDRLVVVRVDGMGEVIMYNFK